MPSRKHQRLVVLLTELPELFVDLVRLCSEIDVPGDLELLPGPKRYASPPPSVSPMVRWSFGMPRTVAKWAGKPIDLGRGRMTLEPLVVGPKQIPTELSLGEARARPDWLALIVMAHGQKRGSERINRMAMKVAREVSRGHGRH